MKGQDALRWYIVPTLRRPYMVAAWSGMGAVALLAANYLRQELDATLFCEIDPYTFFSPSQVIIQKGLVQEPDFPEHKLYLWRSGGPHDLILLIGTEQPNDTITMAQLVVDVAQRLGVERIFTGAALATFMHHAQDAQVWGTATHPDILTELKAQGVRILEEGTISGLNGLLLAIAKERQIDGLCLLGEIPVYATQVINPKAARAVLTVLGALLGIEVDLGKLEAWEEDLAPQLDQLFGILPDRARKAIERHREEQTSAFSTSTSADQPLVADEQFFDEIEQFLKERGDEDEDEDEQEE